jgi:hypothetical protein
MKLRRALFCLFSILLLAFPVLAQETGDAAARDADSRGNGLRIKIECEEPSGVLWDQDTLQTARSVLFSIHVFNETDASRVVTLTWKITDAAGKTALDEKTKYTLDAGQHATKRQLFATAKRGAYLLTANAESRVDGPDLKAQQVFPFGIFSSPPERQTLRRPLVILNAPLALSESDLTFYDRIGARALRSTVVSRNNSNTGVETPQELDAALQARAAHGIGTIGVLVAPARTSLRDDEEWLQASLLLITRYRDIRTWEIVGDPAPDTLNEIARAARNMNPPRSVLTVAPTTSGAQNRSAAVDGLVFYAPRSLTGELHPATLRRAFFASRNLARNLNAPAFHIREDARGSASTQDTALDSAGDFVSRAVLALAAGASGTSASLDAETSRRDADANVQTRFARGAAFTALSNLLDETHFHSEAFPESPVVMAEVFARDSGGSVTVLWAAPDQFGKAQSGKLNAWLPDAELLDLFGNPISSGQRKTLEIPLGATPVYLVSKARPEEVLRVLREGTVNGIAPLAAQVLPLTQPVEKPLDKKADGKAVPPTQTQIRIRLQNIGVRDISGKIEVNPPPSWKLAGTTQNFELAPGNSKIYAFDVLQTKFNDKYPIVVKAIADDKSGRGSWGWNEDAVIATATNITPDETVTVDGRLNDWRNPSWMPLPSADKGRVSAQLALRWDQRNLFVAARVKEPRLQPRRSDALEYSFWQGYDAIQLGFGIKEAAWTIPVSAPFRDTDQGFLLSPFNVRADGTVEGRVLRLWGGTLPFGALPDRVRWGGAVPGARCEVRRDERDGETVYEAMIPLSELPDFAPETRAATAQNAGNPIRFSWILHSSESSALQWASGANVFPWWNNTLSFMPPQNALLAAQTLLGVTQRGEVSSGTSTVSTTPVTTPAPTTAPPATVPPASVPPTVIAPAPIPPNLTPLPLPPAPASSEEPEIAPYFPSQPPSRSSNAMSTRRRAGFIQVAVKSSVEVPAARFAVFAPALTMTEQATPKTIIAWPPSASAANILSRILPFMAEDAR